MKSARRNNTASRLGSQSAFFFGGNVFTLMVGLPLQIYVARMIGADGLGVFSLIDGGIQLAAGVVAFGLAATLVKFIPAHLERGEYACIRRLVGYGALILLTSGGIAYGVMVVALPLATRHWPVLADHELAVMVMGLLIPLSLMAFFLCQALRGFQEIRYMVMGSSFMQLTVKALLSVLLLALGLQLIGYIWAVVVSVLCTVLWMGHGLKRKLALMPRPAESHCKGPQKAWRDYAAVMYGGSLLGIGAQYLDRFLLGIFVGAAPVGVLMVVKQLQQLPGVFLQMLLAVATPMFSAAHARRDSQDSQHIYHLATDWVVRLSIPLFIFFLVFSGPLLSLYGEPFELDGEHAFWILVSGQVVNLGVGPVGNLLNMSGEEGLMLRLSIAHTVISAAGFVLLVPNYGLVGAAVAITLGVVLQNMAALWFAQSKVNLQWADRRYLGWIAPAAISVAVAVLVSILGPQKPGAAMLVLYLLLVYGVFHGVSLAQGLNEDDKELLRHLSARLRRRQHGAECVSRPSE